MSTPPTIPSVSDSRPDAQRWVEQTLKRLNYTIIGEREVIEAWLLGDVWRFPTDKGDVYFKATASLPLFSNEAQICDCLNQLFKDHVPKVLAIDKDRCWQLSSSFGEPLGKHEDASIAAFTEVYELWGNLQRQSVEHVDLLRQSGCQSRHVEHLSEQLCWHIKQPKIAALLATHSIILDNDLWSKLDAQVKELTTFGLPECLVHGDLHDNNMAKTTDSYLFFDWSDACISHPFMEGHIMYRLSWRQDQQQKLIDQYLSNWNHYLSEAELQRAWAAGESACYAHHALTYASFILSAPVGFEDDVSDFVDSFCAFMSCLVNSFEPELQSISELQNLLDKAVQSPAIPGVSAALVKGEQLLWAGAAGFADISRGIKMRVDHLQNIASITKTITATAVMQQVERGNLKLDNDVNEYLAFSVRNPNYPDVPITTRQLLIHRSSITDGPAFDQAYACDDPAIGLREWIEEYLTPGRRFYDADKNFLSWKPGTQDPPTPPRTYSNVAFGLLGHLVERVSQQEFRSYCQTEIFDVLGMTNSCWDIGDTSQHAVPHTYLAPGMKLDDLAVVADSVQTAEVNEGALIAHCLYSFYNYPEGLLRTNPTELSAFLRAYIGEGQLHAKRILQEDTVTQMLSEQHQGQGLCWTIGESSSGGRVFIHRGGDPGVSTFMILRERDQVGVIVFFNCAQAGIQQSKIVNRMLALMNTLEENKLS